MRNSPSSLFNRDQKIINFYSLINHYANRASRRFFQMTPTQGKSLATFLLQIDSQYITYR